MREFAEFFDALHTLQLEVKATYDTDEQQVRVYPGLEPDRIECPAIYNTLDPSQVTVEDTLTDRINLVVGTRIAIYHSEAAQQWAQLFAIADTYTRVMFPGLRDRDAPIRSARGLITGGQQFKAVTNDVPIFGIEFPLRAQLNVPTA